MFYTITWLKVIFSNCCQPNGGKGTIKAFGSPEFNQKVCLFQHTTWIFVWLPLEPAIFILKGIEKAVWEQIYRWAWKDTHNGNSHIGCLRYETVLPVASTTRGDVNDERRGGAINLMVLACTPPLRAGNKFSVLTVLLRSQPFYMFHVWTLACSIFYCPFANGWSGDSSFSPLMNKRQGKSIFSQDWGRATSIKAVPQRRSLLSLV